MRQTSTWTAWLAIVLLAFSFVGQSCAASCGLTHLAALKDVAVQAMPLGCNGMSMSAAQPGTSACTVSTRDCCGHGVCGHAQAEALASAAHQLEQPTIIAASLSIFQPAQMLSQAPREQATHAPPPPPPVRKPILRI